MTPGEQLEACLVLVERIAQQLEAVVTQQGRLVDAVKDIRARVDSLERQSEALNQRTVGLLVCK